VAARLRIEAMHERHRALPPPVDAYFEQAASVCLSRHHAPPVQVTLNDNGTEVLAEVNWTAPDARTLDAWANARVATEHGAYGCVIAGVEELRGLVAVRRADTPTGADYYIGPPGTSQYDLEDCLRLEVSGVDAGDQREVSRRLLQKVQQAREGGSSLPALAGVIGFSARLLMLRDVTEAQ